MHDRELYRQILGIQPPWEVSEVDVDLPGTGVTVWIRYCGASLACPRCDAVPCRAIIIRYSSFSAVATRVIARTLEKLTMPHRKALLIFGSLSNAWATRTFSRAAPSPMPHFQLGSFVVLQRGARSECEGRRGSRPMRTRFQTRPGPLGYSITCGTGSAPKAEAAMPACRGFPPSGTLGTQSDKSAPTLGRENGI